MKLPYYFEHELPINEPPDTFEVLTANCRCLCNRPIYFETNRSSIENNMPPFERLREIPEAFKPHLIIKCGKLVYLCKACYDEYKIDLELSLSQYRRQSCIIEDIN